MRRFILLTTLLATAGVVLAASPGAENGRWVVVTLDRVSHRTPALGTLKARQRTILGPEVSGRVLEVLVDAGDRVKAGQQLVRLDPTTFELGVEQARAALRAARARVASVDAALETARARIALEERSLEEAQRQLERMRNLYEKPSGETPTVARKQYDDALYGQEQAGLALQLARAGETEVEARKEEVLAAVAQAEVALSMAQERLEETIILAPYDAVVTRRLVDVGEPVTSTPVTELLEVQEIGELELEFSVPQALVARVAVGTPLEFRVEGVPGGPHQAYVDVIIPVVDEATRTLRCKARLDNAREQLRPGLMVEVLVEDEVVEEALAIPRGALRETATGWAVLARQPGQPPALRPVVVGLQGSEQVQILEGLQVGEEVQVEVR